MSDGVYYAQVICNTVDTYNISLQGNVPLEMKNVLPKYVIVDNYANAAPCTISYSGLSFTIARYVRKTFEIPANLTSLAITVGSGSVVATFLQKLGLTPDGEDSFAIQQAAAQFVTYPYVSKLSTQTQLIADQNKHILFSNVAAQNYNLLGIAASVIPSGFYNPNLANVGAGRWAIKPAGADTINSVYTNANPLQLSAGDNVGFSSDAVQWYARGRITFNSGQQVFTLGGALTIAHGLVQRPVEIDVRYECTTADAGFAIGDFLSVISSVDNNGVNTSGHSIWCDATNINVRFDNTVAINPQVNKASGAAAVLTAASWRLHIKVALDL